MSVGRAGRRKSAVQCGERDPLCGDVHRERRDTMSSRNITKDAKERPASAALPNDIRHHGGVLMPDDDNCLDSLQLNLLEQSFRTWAEHPARPDIRCSRRRILLIFLVIRYTGAKLNEALAIDPYRDIRYDRQAIVLRNGEIPRDIRISEALSREFHAMLADPDFREAVGNDFGVDPGFVRRKFYERAHACGFPKQSGGPEMIRRSRGVELLRSNMPLPAVQALLGHSTPNLTSAYVSFSDEEIQRVTKHFMEKESARRTSARNSFYGKIQVLQPGDIQSMVKIITMEGNRITTVITNDSVVRLGLKEGLLITAEVKAPWVILEKTEEEPACTAENRFRGMIERVNRGAVNTEYVVRLQDGAELCSIVTSESGRRLAFEKGDTVWAVFNCFAVVLQVD